MTIHPESAAVCRIVALFHDSAYSFSMSREIHISALASFGSLLLGLPLSLFLVPLVR
jgi:hypothetical protein